MSPRAVTSTCRRQEPGGGDIAQSGVNGEVRGFGHRDGEIDAAAIVAAGLDGNSAAVDGDMRSLVIKDFFGVGVRACKGQLVGLHNHGRCIARAHAHVAAWILDVDGGVVAPEPGR